MVKSDSQTVSTPSAAQAESSSRPAKDKKRKRDKSLAKSPPNSSTTETSGREREELDSAGKKGGKKEKRHKKRKAEGIIEHGEAPSEDMTIEPIFTTTTGDLVHTQNAGLILTEYLQAFHQTPGTFVPTFDITLIPPPDLAERKWTRDPKNPGQPPPDSLYTCTVTMPPGVSIRSASTAGPGFRSKQLAKQYASGAMVKKLVDAGQISQKLEPKPTGPAVKEKTVKAKDMRDMQWFDKQQTLGPPHSTAPDTTLNERWRMFKEGVRDHLPPVTRSKDGRRGHIDVTPITSPKFWSTCPPFQSGISIYPTLITLDITGDHSQCRPLCLLTTLRIPETKDGLDIDMSLEAESSRGSVNAKATLHARPKLHSLTTHQLQSAFTFTRRVIREHMALPYESSLKDCQWLVLPMKKDFESDQHGKVKRKHFDWDQVHATNTPIPTPFDLDTLLKLDEKDLSDMMYTIRAEFAQRNAVIKVRTDLNPSSPHPSRPERTIAQNTVYGRDDSPQPEPQHPDQPVLECAIANPGRHGGYLVELAQVQEPHLIVPEFGAQHTFTASVYRSTSVLPILLTRLDDCLIARQLSKTIFSSAITTPLALEAITAPMTTRDHAKSYERLEILGDTLLKLLTTVDLYIRPSGIGIDDEKAHQTRHLVLSNRGLQQKATQAKIPQYIRHVKRKPKDWKPRGWRVVAQPEPGTTSVLGGKIVADVAEALIGASYISQDRAIDSAISAARRMGISLQALTEWSDANGYVQRQPASNTTESSRDPLMSLLQATKIRVLGYDFKDAERGRSVLSRTRTPAQTSACLRFKLLGDSVLEYFIIEDLWDRYPNAGPQEMTVMKHSRMNDGTLSALAATLPIYDQLNGIHRDVQPQHKRYRKAILEARKEADAGGKPDGRADEPLLPDEAGQEWWADLDEAPLVGEVIDLLLGAVLEDSAYDLDVTRKIYRDHFAPFFERYCLGPHRDSLHPKSQLSQLLMGKRHCRHYELRKDGLNKTSSQMEAAIVLHGQAVGRGSAPAQELALRRACGEFMAKVRTDPRWIDTVCDCPSKTK